MAARIKAADTAKHNRKIVKKAAAPAVIATEQPVVVSKSANPKIARKLGRVAKVVKAAKPIAKTAEPIVQAAEPVVAPIAKAIEPIVDAGEKLAAQVEEKVEAVTSPAVESDPVPEVAAPSPIIERISDMPTVTNPTQGFEKGQAMLGDVTARFKTAFEKSSKMSEDMVDFAKGNVEAVVASARVAAKASESFGQEAADYSKKQFESATALFKSFANVKSPTDLFQLQSDFAKSSFDSAVAEASRVSESMMKIAGEIAQPLSSRYAVAAEKMKANVL